MRCGPWRAGRVCGRRSRGEPRRVGRVIDRRRLTGGRCSGGRRGPSRRRDEPGESRRLGRRVRLFDPERRGAVDKRQHERASRVVRSHRIGEHHSCARDGSRPPPRGIRRIELRKVPHDGSVFQRNQLCAHRDVPAPRPNCRSHRRQLRGQDPVGVFGSPCDGQCSVEQHRRGRRRRPRKLPPGDGVESHLRIEPQDCDSAERRGRGDVRSREAGHESRSFRESATSPISMARHTQCGRRAGVRRPLRCAPRSRACRSRARRQPLAACPRRYSLHTTRLAGWRC